MYMSMWCHSPVVLCLYYTLPGMLHPALPTCTAQATLPHTIACDVLTTCLLNVSTNQPTCMYLQPQASAHVLVWRVGSLNFWLNVICPVDRHSAFVLVFFHSRIHPTPNVYSWDMVPARHSQSQAGISQAVLHGCDSVYQSLWPA